MKKVSDLHSSTLADVKQLGIWASLISLGYVFWIVGAMEMVERLAYYGVRTVSGLYATDSVANGGLGVTSAQLGIIFLWWALIQSFVPVFTGGLADRLGYKETIFLSTIFKIAGYLCMALMPTFYGFMLGAMLLAFGTGIFKPGIQGTLVKATNRQNSSMAWGVFYQTVNIGGFLGPIVAAALRQLEWAYVFHACAGIISLNFLLLLAYKEPGKEERLAHKARVRSGEITQEALWIDSLRELIKPIVFVYLLLFSGFWFMFNSLFDVLPLHIRDWVDTTVLVQTLFGADGTSNGFFIRLFGMNNDGQMIQPEGLVNWNAGMIMFFCFLIAGLSGKMRAANSMVLGTILCSAALLIFGGYHYAWFVAVAILVFSTGEMLSSPKFLEFMGNIAPPQKKAMYLGFTQLSLGIGWTLEGYLGPYWYGLWSSKDQLARNLLVERGMDGSAAAAIPQGEAFQRLIEFTGQSGEALTQLLRETNNIGLVWYIMGGVGLVSALGIWLYGRWLRRLTEAAEATPTHATPAA